MMNKIVLLASLIIATPALAAMSIEFRDSHSWKYNDLSKEDQLKTMLSGADGTILDMNDHVSTVRVYTKDLPAGVTLGNKVADWKKVVVADTLDHATIKKEKTFKVDGEWRYYIESILKADGEEIGIASMALIKGGRVVMFTFQQDPKLFNPRVKAVRELYSHLKVDKL